MTPSPGPTSEHLHEMIALDTAARRFYEDRFAEWSQMYSGLQAKENFKTEKLFKAGWEYSPEAYAIFPKYRLDKATRIEVERLSPDSSGSLQNLRVELVRASDIAERRLRSELNNDIALKALGEEADEYKAYVSGSVRISRIFNHNCR